MAKRYYYDNSINGSTGIIADTDKFKVELYKKGRKVATRDYKHFYGNKNYKQHFDKDLKNIQNRFIKTSKEEFNKIMQER